MMGKTIVDTRGRLEGELVRMKNMESHYVTVFGDDTNDIKMMNEADKSIAVVNAKTDIKAIANQIVLSNSEDGVVKYMLKAENILDLEMLEADFGKKGGGLARQSGFLPNTTPEEMGSCKFVMGDFADTGFPQSSFLSVREDVIIDDAKQTYLLVYDRRANVGRLM